MSSQPTDSGSSSAYLQSNQQLPFDNSMMIAAIIVLFVVLISIFGLHVYAKWFWRHSQRTASLRRLRFDFTGQDAFIVGGSVGLDKAAIDSLPAFVYHAADEAVLECAVCLCEFEEKEHGRLLPKCNHRFHTDCIDMWFYSHSTCPLCRTIVIPESLPAAQNEQTSSSQISVSLSPLSLQVSGESRTLDQLGRGMQTSEVAISGLIPERPHTRSVPQISIDVQIRADNLTSSLSSPRHSPTDEQSCSSPASGQPLKSPSGLRISIKRILSRERRVFPSDRESVELEQDTLLPPV